MLLALQQNNLLGAGSAPILASPIQDISVRVNNSENFDLGANWLLADSYSIAPAVPGSWNFNTSTGVLTVDENDVGTYGTYVVTATNANGSTDSNAFSVNVLPLSTGAGTSNKQKRRKRYVVEVDGQVFQLEDINAAVALLEQAVEIARTEAPRQAKKVVRKQIRKKRPTEQASIRLPEIITRTPSVELQPIVQQFRTEIERIYSKAIQEAETAILIRRQIRRQDEDEAIQILLMD